MTLDRQIKAFDERVAALDYVNSNVGSPRGTLRSRGRNLSCRSSDNFSFQISLLSFNYPIRAPKRFLEGFLAMPASCKLFNRPENWHPSRIQTAEAMPSRHPKRPLDLTPSIVNCLS
jgi:hypothetical protein